MTNNLGRSLLQQDGLNPGTAPSQAQAELRLLIDRSKRRARRMKRLMTLSWLVFVPYWILFVVMGAFVFEHYTSEHMTLFCWMVGLVVLMPVVAVVFTISYFIRSRGASMMEINARLLRLEENLQAVLRPTKP